MTLALVPNTVRLVMLVAAVACSPSESVELQLPDQPPEVAGSIALPDGALPAPQPPLIVSAPQAFPSGGACVTPSMETPPAFWHPPMVAATTPPPISGGTMLTTADGSTVVAADPDRDQLYFVDATGMSHLHTRALNAGDEPGRLVEDAAGRIHVVLRGAARSRRWAAQPTA